MAQGVSGGGQSEGVAAEIHILNLVIWLGGQWWSEAGLSGQCPLYERMARDVSVFSTITRFLLAVLMPAVALML